MRGIQLIFFKMSLYLNFSKINNILINKKFLINCIKSFKVVTLSNINDNTAIVFNKRLILLYILVSFVLSFIFFL